MLDIDEYLPPDTLNWCQTKLLEIIGENSLQLTAYDIFPDGERVHQSIYMELKLAITNHVEAGLLPVLSETVHPTGGRNWTPQASFDEGEEAGVFGEEEIEFVGDGPDEALEDNDLNQVLD